MCVYIWNVYEDSHAIDLTSVVVSVFIINVNTMFRSSRKVVFERVDNFTKVTDFVMRGGFRQFHIYTLSDLVDFII